MTYNQKEDSIEGSIKHIILNNAVPVGVISVFEEKKGYYYLCCLCVVPPYQGMGIGTQAFQYSLSHYSYIITPIRGISKDAAGHEKRAAL